MIAMMAVYTPTPHGSAHDPTDPEQLLSATRIPAEGQNVTDIVVYRKEVHILLCGWLPAVYWLLNFVGYRCKTNLKSEKHVEA